MTTETKTKLIYRDQEEITRHNEKLRKTLELLKDIPGIYKTVFYLPEFNTENLTTLLNDHANFIEDSKKDYYNANYAAKHNEIGIKPDVGFTWVEWPDTSKLIHEVMQVINALRRDVYTYGPYSEFIAENGEIVIDPVKVAEFEKRHEVYIDSPSGYAYESAITRLLEALSDLETLNEESGKHSLSIFGHSKCDYNKLSSFINHAHDRWSDKSTLKLNVDFFRTLK